MELLLSFIITISHDARSSECQSPSTAVHWGKNVISYDNDSLTNLTETSTGFIPPVSAHTYISTYIHTHNCACYGLQCAAEAATWLV